MELSLFVFFAVEACVRLLTVKERESLSLPQKDSKDISPVLPEGGNDPCFPFSPLFRKKPKRKPQIKYLYGYGATFFTRHAHNSLFLNYQGVVATLNYRAILELGSYPAFQDKRPPSCTDSWLRSFSFSFYLFPLQISNLSQQFLLPLRMATGQGWESYLRET